jgi:anti-sigma28 factor (negative regulator of flagellin synthesis)
MNAPPHPRTFGRNVKSEPRTRGPLPGRRYRAPSPTTKLAHHTQIRATADDRRNARDSSNSRREDRARRVAAIDKEDSMPLARAVTFDGVNKDRIEEIKREMAEGERPEGLPATEIILLHDADAEKSLVILFFDSEDDYARGDEALNAMPTGDTPGQRTSVTKYDVAIRMSA